MLEKRALLLECSVQKISRSHFASCDRWTGDKPRRTSRVGTDCYMAPEVRWARKQNQSYGTSCDWYTVGVLLYELTNGSLPYSRRDSQNPVYTEGKWPNLACKRLCEGLLTQDWKKRIGCGPDGVDEIKKDPYFKHVDWDIVTACKARASTLSSASLHLTYETGCHLGAIAHERREGPPEAQEG